MTKKDLIGVVLAGGMGTRMGKRIGTNKHLTQIYDRPMIDYPLKTLVSAGIMDIIIVTGPEHAGDFSNVLEWWRKEKGVRLSYVLQREPLGIAHALGLTEFVVGDRKVVVILGDNYFEDNIKEEVENFSKAGNGYIFLKKLPDELLFEVKDEKRRARFGIATVRQKRVIKIEEKPEKPESNLVVTGLYMYPADVFEKIKQLKPSWRNELEITDVNNIYIKENRLGYFLLKGFWSDMGNPESVYKTISFIRKVI